MSRPTRTVIACKGAYPSKAKLVCRTPAMSLFLSVAASGTLLSAVAIGCGGAANPIVTEAAGGAVDARVALRGAVREALQLKSAAFTLEHLKGTTSLIPGFVEMRKVSGVVDLPDSFRLKVEAETVVPRTFVEISVVTISDQAFMTDIITGKWRQVKPESLPFSLSNLGRTLANIIDAVDAPTYVGAERLKGYDTHHFQGRVMSQDLAGLVPGAGQGFNVALDLWLEQSRNLLLQARISGIVVPTDEPGTVRLLTLDDVNVPVKISPPE